MTEFEFVDELPPVPFTRRAVLDEFAAALRDRPGVWAKWPTSLTPASARTTNAAIRRGKYKHLPAHEFEATVRAGVLYARFHPQADGAG
jgi:hypothetical protein